MRNLFRGVVGLAILATLWVATPDVQAQRRGGGGGGWGGRGSGSWNGWGGGRGGVYFGNGYGYGSGWNGYGYGRGYGYDRYYYPRGYSYDSYVYPPVYQDYQYPTEVYQSNYPPADYAPAQATTTTARIRIRVPDANAAIWFNGSSTRQHGMDRVFETPALSAGYTHTYEIRARWTGADGQVVERTRSIDVQPGQEFVVNF